MAISDLDYIRLILSVPHRVVLTETLGTGDGTTKKFKIQLWPIIDGSETVRVDGTAKTVVTHYTIDNNTGLVTFVTAPPDTEVVDADYTWSVFSDIQIEGLLTKYHDAVTAVLKVLIRALLANTDLFIKYTTGMESVDRSAALKALQSLLEDLGKQPASAAAQAVIWKEADVLETERDVPWEDFLSSTPGD